LHQIVANVNTWNPYLHTCKPYLLNSGVSLPTAIDATIAAAATITATATRFFQKIILSLK
jgi:hypothetical protein